MSRGTLLNNCKKRPPGRWFWLVAADRAIGQHFCFAKHLYGDDRIPHLNELGGKVVVWLDLSGDSSTCVGMISEDLLKEKLGSQIFFFHKDEKRSLFVAKSLGFQCVHAAGRDPPSLQVVVHSNVDDVDAARPPFEIVEKIAR